MSRPQNSFEPNQGPKNSPVWSKKGPNNSKSRSTLRVRIEGNIENRNCYGIRIDYDKEVDKEEEKEKEEEKVKGT